MERRGYSSEASPDPRAAAPVVRGANYVTGGGGDDGAAAAAPAGTDASFDANMVIILAALFFALLFAVGLNSLARCALRCGGRAAAGGHRGGASSSRVVGVGGGIKRRALRSIPVEVYGNRDEAAEEEDVCAICLGEFAGGEKVRVLPRCGHCFHVPCVDAWLLSRGSCPTCRRPVIMDDGKQSPAAKAAGGVGGGQSRRRPEGDTIAVVIA